VECSWFYGKQKAFKIGKFQCVHRFSLVLIGRNVTQRLCKGKDKKGQVWCFSDLMKMVER
jgi:hypothetical protein